MIDSYKGVMLCKRPSLIVRRNSTQHEANNGNPSTGVSKSNMNTISKEEGSFLCGKVPSPWGSTKVIPEKARTISRLSRHDGALQRHKRWLKEMQMKREKHLKEKEQREREKDEKKREFMDRQAKRRARAREMEEMEDNIHMENATSKRNKENDIHDIDSGHFVASPLQQVNSGEKRSRPAWSMTETEANNEYKCQLAEEEEDLMKFVEDLDFEQYNHDMELRLLVAQMKDRVRTLEKEKKSDELRLRHILDSELAAARDEKFNNDEHLDMSTMKKESTSDNPEEEDLHSIAATIKSQDDASICSIHSQRSLKMLVSKAKDRLHDGPKGGKDKSKLKSRSPLGTVQEYENYGGETNLRPPVTIIHTEDQGARLAEKNNLNKLPFKNRNPAL